MFIKRDLFSEELGFIASPLFIDYPSASTPSRATSDLEPNVLQETPALSSNIVKQLDKSLPSWRRLTGQLRFYWPQVFVLLLCAERM